MLGDVSGKGAEAAAVTALTRYTLRALADPHARPSHTLRLLNEQMVSTTDTERHCTLVYAVARTGGHGLAVTLSLAGHHPPLLTRSHGEVEPTGELGTAVGLLDDVELHDVQVLLDPGDSLCLFTDGLVEARRHLTLFGEDRVAEILREGRHRPLEDLADELVDAPRRFHGPELADDLAVLLLRAAPARGTGAAPVPSPA